MVPEWLQAIVLGVVQGLTEFIPVSSSGHLVLVPFVAGWERPGLAFDVALHVGTAFAIIVYFRRDLLAMTRAMLTPGRDAASSVHRRLGLLLVLASAPVAVAGLLLKDLFEAAFETPRLAAVMLLVTASLLVGGERLRTRRIRRSPAPVGAGGMAAARPPVETSVPLGVDVEDPDGATLAGLTVRHALIVGAGQMMALMPGLSRSGTTITAGLAAGLTREAATRFSFLLALPALIGAAIVSLPDLAEPGPYSGIEILGGVVASFLAGYAAITFLVRLVTRRGLSVFAVYLVAASMLGFAATFVR